jgi:hypothetical protein
MPTVECRVPISPTPSFRHRVELLERSMRRAGGALATARLVVSVGADVEPFDLRGQDGSRDPLVEWRWVDRSWFRSAPHFCATGCDRFLVHSDADVVLFLDADTVFVAPIDDLVVELARWPAVAGVIAHFPPFAPGPGPKGWDELFAVTGIEPPEQWFAYSGIERDDRREAVCPAYFNFGFVAVPRSLLKRLAPAYLELAARVRTLGVGAFGEQVALALAIARERLPVLALGMRFNWPNDPAMTRLHPAEETDVRVVHYLREAALDRERDFANPTALRALVERRDLTGANELVRRLVEELGLAEGTSEPGLEHAADTADCTGLEARQHGRLLAPRGRRAATPDDEHPAAWPRDDRIAAVRQA